MEAVLAFELILSNERYYNSATRHNDYSVTLTSTDVVCPYCNCSSPVKADNEISKCQLETMEKWANPQLSFWAQEKVRKELFFFEPDFNYFSCPHCGKQSYDKNRMSILYLTEKENKVTIRCEITELNTLLNMSYLDKAELSLEFPLYEQIEFDFTSGNTYIRLMTESDKVLYEEEITNIGYAFTENTLINQFLKYDAVRNMILESFRTVTNTDIPINPEKLLLSDFIFFSRFIGYDENFYNSIPYNKETLIIDDSFDNLQKLHTKEAAINYLYSFPFAKYKSIRKLVFEQPGMLFYLPECAVLYDAVRNVDIFKNILDSRYIFVILVMLHQCPISAEFFSDYCRIKSAGSLLKIISCTNYSWYDLKCYITNYCLMSFHSKSLEQKKWNDKSYRHYINETLRSDYSLPITMKSTKNTEHVICGFTFRMLKNTCGCLKVGRELHNCIVDWESYDSNIVVVSKSGKTVAAIEIDEDRIIQAHTYRNGDIREVEELPEAIRIWKEKSGIHYQCPYVL